MIPLTVEMRWVGCFVVVGGVQSLRILISALVRGAGFFCRGVVGFCGCFSALSGDAGFSAGVCPFSAGGHGVACLVFVDQLWCRLVFARTLAVIFLRRWPRLRGLWAATVMRSSRARVALLWCGLRFREAVLGGLVVCLWRCSVVGFGVR